MNASRDENDIPTLLGISNVDGSTPVTVYADPVTHRLLVDSSGGGGGTIGGSIAATQIAYGSGTNTITGSSTLTTDGTTLTTGAIAITANVAPTTGIYSSAGNNLNFAANSNLSFTINSSGTVTLNHTLLSTTSGGFELVSGNASSTVPTIVPNRGDTTTGIGAQATGNISQIVGGVEVGRWTSTGLNNAAIGATTASTGAFTTLTATTLNGNTITTGTGTLTLGTGKTLTASNTLTFTGTDGSSVAFGTGGTVLYAGSTIPLTVGSTTIASGTNFRVLMDNSGVLGEYATTGTGTVAMSTSPTFITPTLGVATATSINNVAITAPGTSATLALAASSTFATSGAFSLTLQVSGNSTVIFPSGTNTIVTQTGGATLTNKRITRRSATTNAPGATPATNTDAVDLQIFTGLATAITSMTSSLTGTPVTGDFLEFWLTDNGTAQAITWGASFASTTVTLPATTVISTKLRVLFEWGGSTWDCVAIA